MGAADLVDISTRSDFKEITARGGSSKSEAKHKAHLIRGAYDAKCSHCKLDCEFRELNVLNNPEATCCVPILRGHAKLNGERVVNWNDGRIKQYLGVLLELYAKYCLESESNENTPKKQELERMRRMNTLFHRLSDFKELYEPPVQKNVNLNINTTAEAVVERIRSWKKKQAEGVVIVKETENDEGSE
jgi:hypothetical protein